MQTGEPYLVLHIQTFLLHFECNILTQSKIYLLPFVNVSNPTWYRLRNDSKIASITLVRLET